MIKLPELRISEAQFGHGPIGEDEHDPERLQLKRTSVPLRSKAGGTNPAVQQC